MSTLSPQFPILTIAGWVNRNQQDVIEYLQEENRILRDHVGDRRLSFTDARRRRLAMRARKLNRNTLARMEPIVTPDTLVRWYRNLVARKQDGSKARRAGRLRTAVDVERRIEPGGTPGRGRIGCRKRLGGLLRYCYRRAA
jgi:putative transposase